jgi:hypothetical protein
MVATLSVDASNVKTIEGEIAPTPDSKKLTNHAAPRCLTIAYRVPIYRGPSQLKHIAWERSAMDLGKRTGHYCIQNHINNYHMTVAIFSRSHILRETKRTKYHRNSWRECEHIRQVYKAAGGATAVAP